MTTLARRGLSPLCQIAGGVAEYLEEAVKAVIIRQRNNCAAPQDERADILRDERGLITVAVFGRHGAGRCPAESDCDQGPAGRVIARSGPFVSLNSTAILGGAREIPAMFARERWFMA
jgi:hypothetical protein